MLPLSSCLARCMMLEMSALQFTRRECKEKLTKQQSDPCPLLPTPPDPCMNWPCQYVKNSAAQLFLLLLLLCFCVVCLCMCVLFCLCVCVCVCVSPYWFFAHILPSARLETLMRLGMWWSLSLVCFCEGAREGGACLCLVCRRVYLAYLSMYECI